MTSLAFDNAAPAGDAVTVRIRFDARASQPHIHSKDGRLVPELARREKIGLTEAVHIAVAKELRRRPGSLWERIAPLRENLRKRIKDPRPVTKEFRDRLYEDSRPISAFRGRADAPPFDNAAAGRSIRPTDPTSGEHP